MVFTSNWYADASTYWSQVKPDIDGMLGGLGHLHAQDLTGSRDFLYDLQRARGGPEQYECIAGKLFVFASVRYSFNRMWSWYWKDN
jgi:hypothetical protein